MHPLIAGPATIALVIRAYSHNSLTIPGIFFAVVTAIIHALHPSPIPFTLLCTFFLLGTAATKVKKDVKAHLTQSGTGNTGGEGARTSIQVLANSACASIAVLCHLNKYGTGGKTTCFALVQEETDVLKDMLLFGVICNYAAVAADTLSSELGILAKTKPVLITTLKTVPHGTNGGVTFTGIIAGMGGSAAIAASSLALLSFCMVLNLDVQSAGDNRWMWSTTAKVMLFLFITIWGTLGSVLDSVLGALLQASVIDRRTGKVIEGAGGGRVLISSPEISSVDTKNSSDRQTTRLLNSGKDILDNNQINFLMASIMTIGGMVVAATVSKLAMITSS